MMQLKTDIQLATMIRSMKDVIIPAIDPVNQIALEQAQLTLGMLSLMSHQQPLQYRFDRDELKRLLACTQTLLSLTTANAGSVDALKSLKNCSISASEVFECCTVDPSELTKSIRQLREATGAVMTAATEDKTILDEVETAVLKLSKEQLLRDRALLLPQGWEPDTTDLPKIESLLNAI